MINELVLATGNRHKVQEIVELLKITGLRIRSLADLGIKSDVEEDGTTFKDNAIKKAAAAMRLTGLPSLADDSGLEVDALGGRPGVYSSRFAHQQATDAENNRHLLHLLAGIPRQKRSARFRCVMALILPHGQKIFAEGICEGFIDLAEKGTHGFGYDPLFLVPGYGKTLAELGPDIKNRISHRAKAVEILRNILLQKVTS